MSQVSILKKVMKKLAIKTTVLKSQSTFKVSFTRNYESSSPLVSHFKFVVGCLYAALELSWQCMKHGLPTLSSPSLYVINKFKGILVLLLSLLLFLSPSSGNIALHKRRQFWTLLDDGRVFWPSLWLFSQENALNAYVSYLRAIVTLKFTPPQILQMVTSC